MLKIKGFLFLGNGAFQKIQGFLQIPPKRGTPNTTGWHWAIARPVLPQIRACEHYRTRLLTILLRYVLLAHIIFC